MNGVGSKGLVQMDGNIAGYESIEDILKVCKLNRLAFSSQVSLDNPSLPRRLTCPKSSSSRSPVCCMD